MVALLGPVLALAACTPARATEAGKPSTTSVPRHSSTPVPASSSTTTTTTLPAIFGVGLHVEHWVDHQASTDCGPTAQPYRTLVTDIFYPSSAIGTSAVAGAAPARAGAPYPVIVFAAGYDELPSTYAALLDAWVAAGMVVVAPVFPCTNANHVAAVGGLAAAFKLGVEDDTSNEPGDVAFVIAQLVAADASPATFLHPLVDMSELGLAGQSDGADAVAALVYDSAYAAADAAMPARPVAVAVLSGAALPGTYRNPADPPDELSAESTADECNPQSGATALYDAVGGDKAFLEIDGASHMAPYTGAGQWAEATEAATTAWFEQALGWRSAAAARAQLSAAGNIAGITSLSNSPSAPPMHDILSGGYGDVPSECGL